VIRYSETSASPRDEASSVVGEDAIVEAAAVGDDAVSVWNAFIVGEVVAGDCAARESPAPSWGASTPVPQPTNPANNAASASGLTKRNLCNMS
jgi:hypothetical protein